MNKRPITMEDCTDYGIPGARQITPASDSERRSMELQKALADGRFGHLKEWDGKAMLSDNMYEQDNGPFPDAPYTWEDIARALYSLLDDCDTADDIAKGDDQRFREIIRQKHKKRFRYGIPDRHGISVFFNVQGSRSNGQGGKV